MVFIVFAGALLFALPAPSDAATLTLSPQEGSYATGTTIPVAIWLDTQGEAIDGVDVKLMYDPSLLEVVDTGGYANVDPIQIKPGSLMPNTVDNRVDAAAGKITFSQITAGGQRFTSQGNQLLATISFSPIGPGTASVRFDYTPGSSRDSNVAARGGVDVLSSVVGASFTITGPRIKAVPISYPVAPPPISFTPPAYGARSYTFTRDLKNGSRGEDVRMLQKFLNERGFMLAASGSGSPENETDYFGPLTHAALIRYQEFFMGEILNPVGLARGSGYFGSSTRKHFHSIMASAPPAPPC